MEKAIDNKDEVVFEILDYSYIFTELGLFSVGIFSAIVIYIYNGSIHEAYSSLTPFGQFAFAYLIFRGLSISYLAFVSKNYKIIFYQNRIKRTKTNEIRDLDNFKNAYNVFWQIATDKTAYWNPFKVIFLIIAIPGQIFIMFLVITKWIGTMIYSKKFLANQYSLVVVFNDEKLINFSYGFLNNEEKKFIEEYFSKYFNIKNLEKGFLMLPAEKGEENE